jgi:type II secretory ATPase GspE/PulE/Tfp pilus assembly ATPase PilB-like protein
VIFTDGGVFELWRLDEEDYHAILTHHDEHALRQALAARREQDILSDAVHKVTEGWTTLSEIRMLGGGN